MDWPSAIAIALSLWALYRSYRSDQKREERQTDYEESQYNLGHARGRLRELTGDDNGNT